MDALATRVLADLCLADLTDIPALLRRFINEIEATPDRVHSAVLAVSVLQVTRAVVERAHTRHPVNGCTCYAAACEPVGRLAPLSETDTGVVYRTWIERFLAHLANEHPPKPAHSAAALMRRSPPYAWTLKELARHVALRPVRLSAQFEGDFGMRPGEYLHLVRVARALPLFETSAKVEAIAWETGYRSKKDLYGALRRWVGASPTDLRGLSPEERHWLERQLRIRMVSAFFGGREPVDTPACRQRGLHHRSVRLPHT
jgi:AraC-like DNA-binding protein